MFVPRDHPIAVADGVFNAILVDGNALGEALFYGQGAGRLPTASAVVADVIECALSTESISRSAPWRKSDRTLIRAHDACQVCALVRLGRSVSVDSIRETLKKPALSGWNQQPKANWHSWPAPMGN